ncbi:hypothetical protein Patl1_28582 [Pistacia atlantica]|uniref:Uncharacterized protein n=1 Tax=Pistacia atlantica TaxID=434234 RepID=A0ACC1BG54_9ROSI|nr:hypothetical protein Patl1_28582 [Pistacia atlantica]
MGTKSKIDFPPPEIGKYLPPLTNHNLLCCRQTKDTTTIAGYRGPPPPLRCLARRTLSVLLKSVVLSLNLSSEFELQSNLHSNQLSSSYYICGSSSAKLAEKASLTLREGARNKGYFNFAFSTFFSNFSSSPSISIGVKDFTEHVFTFPGLQCSVNRLQAISYRCKFLIEVKCQISVGDAGFGCWVMGDGIATQLCLLAARVAAVKCVCVAYDAALQFDFGDVPLVAVSIYTRTSSMK